jgi:hypothetical protein
MRREGFCVFLCLFVAMTLLGDRWWPQISVSLAITGGESITVPGLRLCGNDSA